MVLIWEGNLRSADLKWNVMFCVDNFKFSFRIKWCMPTTRHSISLWIQWRTIDTEYFFHLEIGFVMQASFDLLIDRKRWIKLSEVFDLKIEKDRSILFKTNKSIVGGIVISISDKRNTIINLTKVGGKLNDSKDNKVKSWSQMMVTKNDKSDNKAVGPVRRRGGGRLGRRVKRLIVSSWLRDDRKLIVGFFWSGWVLFHCFL